MGQEDKNIRDGIKELVGTNKRLGGWGKFEELGEKNLFVIQLKLLHEDPLALFSVSEVCPALTLWEKVQKGEGASP